MPLAGVQMGRFNFRDGLLDLFLGFELYIIDSHLFFRRSCHHMIMCDDSVLPLSLLLIECGDIECDWMDVSGGCLGQFDV